MDPPIVVRPASLKPKFYLPKAACRLLQGYYDHSPSGCPTHEDKATLLDQIRTIEGCEGYDAKRLRRWFENRQRFSGKLKQKRTKQSKTVIETSMPVTDLLYPSIKSNIHPTLTVLLSSNPNPNPEIIKVWADHLTINVNSGTEVAVDDIATWIRVHQGMNVLDMPGSSAYSPLTPPESTSPEPQTDDSAMEPDSPAATQREILAEFGQSYNFQHSWNVNKEDSLLPISLRQAGSDFLPVQTQPVADALSPRPPRMRRHEYAMDIDTSRSSAVSMNLSVPHSRQPGLMAQYSSSQLPIPPPPKKTPISDVIRGLSLLTIPLPSPSPSSCSQQLPPLSNNLSEVIKRQSHTANVAQRFLDMLDGGKLKVLGWPQNLNSAAGGDPFT